MHTISGLAGGCKNICNYNNDQIISGCTDSNLYIYNYNEYNYSLESILSGHLESINSLQISNCNTLLLSGANDG